MDGVRYFIFNLKEPDYVSKRMSTFGCLAEEEPCIEKSWVTAFWENRVFAFVLAITEVNTWIAKQYFVLGENYMTLLQMRTQLVSEPVCHPYLDITEEKDDDVTENVNTRRKS
eukprot:5922165-Ditylum_brightwellii.AAC.1